MRSMWNWLGRTVVGMEWAGLISRAEVDAVSGEGLHRKVQPFFVVMPLADREEAIARVQASFHWLDAKTVPDYPWGGVISPISSLSTFSPIFRPWRSSIGTFASANRKERAVTAQPFSVSTVTNGRKARSASLRSAMKAKKNAQHTEERQVGTKG